jgi:hypothetical protein
MNQSCIERLSDVAKTTFTIIGLCCLSSLTHAESQFVCKFTSETIFIKQGLQDLQPRTSKINEEYLLVIDEKRNQSSVVNLKGRHLIELLIVLSNSKMTTFIENSFASDNHFSLSVFWKANSDGGFPALKYNHSWEPEIFDGYAPGVALGSCR